MLSSIIVSDMNQSDVGATGQSFAEAVLGGRQRLGLSQRALAQQLADLGVTIDQASIARMESGRREPRLSEAVAIAEFLQFDILQIDYGHPNVSYYGAMQTATHNYFDARLAVAKYLRSAKDVATQYKLWELRDLGSDDDGEFLELTSSLQGNEKSHGAQPTDWGDLDWNWCRPYLANLISGLNPDLANSGAAGDFNKPRAVDDDRDRSTE